MLRWKNNSENTAASLMFQNADARTMPFQNLFANCKSKPTSADQAAPGFINTKERFKYQFSIFLRYPFPFVDNIDQNVILLMFCSNRNMA